MNVVTSTWRQLVDRRLWPVALLLVAALVAIPIVLAHDAEPAQPTEPVAAAKAEGDLTTPVVANATAQDRDRRRRVLGARKDPFRPSARPQTTAQATAATQATSPTHSTAAKPYTTGGSAGDTTTETLPSFSVPSAPSGGGGGGGGGGTSVPSYSIPTPVAPKKPTYPAGSVIVRFGDATGGSLDRKLVRPLSPLNSDDMPVLVYMGLTKDGKRAKFLVDYSLEPTGDGVCTPHESNCETVELAKGETEFFDVVDPQTGNVTSTLELDLLAINKP